MSADQFVAGAFRTWAIVRCMAEIREFIHIYTASLASIHKFIDCRLAGFGLPNLHQRQSLAAHPRVCAARQSAGRESSPGNMLGARRSRNPARKETSFRSLTRQIPFPTLPNPESLLPVRLSAVAALESLDCRPAFLDRHMPARTCMGNARMELLWDARVYAST